jgi:formylglycine-generating enzyme required for sulfatase activity
LGQTNANDWHSLTFLRLPATNYQWFDSTAPALATRFYRAVPFGAPTNMVFIPPGTFRMGSPTNEVGRNPYGPTTEEGAQTEVTISRGFWMGKYEVTQAEYQAVMGNNPSDFKGDPNRPVDSVTWFNATNYCGKLTQRERAADRISNNSAYRLPTEGEWEYACRALTSTRFSYGDDPDDSGFSRYGWYDGNSDSTTHPVGLKLPNPWGLYDMHGNVAEWCQDWFAPHPGGSTLDPKGPATGTDRVSKGGIWLRPPTSNRSAFRLSIPPDFISDGEGFRVVLAAGQP